MRGGVNRTNRGKAVSSAMRPTRIEVTMSLAIPSLVSSSNPAARASHLPSQSDVRSIVFVIDDDRAVRESLESLINSAGWHTEAFASAQEFLARSPPTTASCLVLDVALPDLNGLELQERLVADRMDMPIIFITGYGDVLKAVRAMKSGAVDFLTKPFRDDALLRAIEHALERSRTVLSHAHEMRALRECYASLSHREREVMALVVAGRLNKQVAAELGISEITVKAHRGKVMRKMRARTLPALVNMAARIGVGSISRRKEEADMWSEPFSDWNFAPMPWRNSRCQHDSGIGRCEFRTASLTAVSSSCPSNGFVNKR
jgi:FixJ family two-component response regulator